MMSIRASIDGDTHKTLAVDLAAYGDKVNVAAARAINRSMVSGRAVMARGIVAATRLKAGDVKQNYLGLTTATPEKPSATLSLQRTMVPVMKLRPKGRNPSRSIPGGITYQFMSQDINRPSAFFATFASGHTDVYERIGRSRLPIQEVKQDISEAFTANEPDTLAKLQEVMPDNFTHELGRL